jgi:antitoxin VapB
MVDRHGRMVDMGLNIKNDETHRLAQELARLTGENMTVAVSEAIRERLERVRGNSKEDLAERIMKIAKECGPFWKEPYKSIEHGELLYDENGLPKGLK